MGNQENAVVLTAETEQGRLAIAQVMGRSYVAETCALPPAWVRALIVDDVPLSFIVVDPRGQMEYPGGDLGFAFIRDVATREDRRREGHFRYIMEHTLASLRAAGIALVVTHGRYQLYRRFGFDVFTHHCGIFVTPEQIQRTLGALAPEGAEKLLVLQDGQSIQDDLLLVVGVKATTLSESKAALQAAAALARQRDKARILFEHPAAPSYGSRYPIHPALETPLTILARTCGARVCVKGADPEGGPVPDADWIKVLDTIAFLRQAVRGLESLGLSLPTATIGFDTGAAATTVACAGGRVMVSEGIAPGATRVEWPSSALAQLVTGYRPVEVLCALHGTPMSAQATTLLEALFPPRWRLSRNESWIYKSGSAIDPGRRPDVGRFAHQPAR